MSSLSNLSTIIHLVIVQLEVSHPRPFHLTHPDQIYINPFHISFHNNIQFSLVHAPRILGPDSHFLSHLPIIFISDNIPTFKQWYNTCFFILSGNIPFCSDVLKICFSGVTLWNYFFNQAHSILFYSYLNHHDLSIFSFSISHQLYDFFFSYRFHIQRMCIIHVR